MAFTSNTLATLGQQAKRGVSPSLFSYRTVDSKSAVLASGYFDNGFTSNTGARAILSVGDIILCDCLDGNFTLRVSSNAAGVVSASELQNAGQNSTAAVLIGDSMVDTYETFALPVVTQISYAPLTGVLTVTSSNHSIWTGKICRFWNYNYASVRDVRFLPATRVDANTYTLTLPDKPQDIPSGNLAATLFCHPIDTAINFTHWLGIAQMQLGHPLKLLANLAQNGETSQGLLGRFDAQVKPYNPGLIIYQLCGLNDNGAGAPAAVFSTELSKANNRKILDKIAAMGARLLLLTTTPVASGEVRGNAATMQRIIEINADALAYSRRIPNCQVIDAYSEIVNPTDATGYAVAARLRSADLIHYNYTGSARIAPHAVAALQAWYPRITPRGPKATLDCHQNNKLTISSMSRAADGLTVTVNTTGNHNWRVGDSFTALSISAAENGVFVVASVPSTTQFTYVNAGAIGAISAGSAVLTLSKNCWNNPLFQVATGGTTTNGVTGTAAGRLTVTNAQGNTGTFTCAASVPAAPAGTRGNEQLLTITAGANNDKPRIAEVGTTAFLNDMLPNRKYRWRGKLRLASANWGLTPINQFLGTFTITWSTGEVYGVSMAGGWDAAESPTIVTDQILYLESGLLETPPPQAGATITGASFLVQINIGGALTAQLLMGLAEVSIQDVTDED